MKYQNLYIDFEPSWETYNKVTEIIGRIPQKHEKSEFDETNEPSTWWLQLLEDEENDIYVDFINVFMDLLEPKFDKLKNIGIEKENILIWLVYEYEQQCALGFNPKELERLGKNGIALNIDCHERRK
ncbi:hypothetical protein Fleli_2333 [Bernardetia litoralis DSM 6794]|uniref:DUF4279 domain-containing protein n=1 Tax=Bernardetia litoralis (strain ATCC 23117 / DSM 6794 / NBRC 15988 / NCIMB 1366 / Fx l1 / Sio-4) TaxID=880071 RepID=I4AFK9_BERLS|nr:hypothetical protein [Bernardetia litoralis]AFM02744.1 hypothetical protein Fleli_0255 [Bernardetia litoralis DSM 6794]AFM04706.1 hypothetical protein Fleli_2333 [Bernardetia litoralis DSM 6794]